MSQWLNDYGVRIRIGCMSCKFSEDSDVQLTSKLCTIDDTGDNKHDRCFQCRAWEPREMFKWIGSGFTQAGAKAHPGDVKSKEYFTWLIKNASESWMPLAPADKQELFKKSYPDIKLYYIKA